MLQDPNVQIGQIEGFSEKDVEIVPAKYETTNLGDSTQSQFATFITLVALDICAQLRIPLYEHKKCTATANAIRRPLNDLNNILIHP